MDKTQKRDLLLKALRHAGGFTSLSARIDCAVPNLVAYAAGIVEVPDGILTSVRRELKS